VYAPARTRCESRVVLTRELAGTWRDATAAMDSESAKRVRRSSPTNWLSCECVRLEKMTWRRGGASTGPPGTSSAPSLSLLLLSPTLGLAQKTSLLKDLRGLITHIFILL